MSEQTTDSPRLHHADAMVGAASLTPDGSTLISVGGRHLVIWEAKTGEQRHLVKVTPTRGGLCGACPTDGQFAYAGSNTISRIDVATGKITLKWVAHADGGIVDIALSPDGTLVASTSFYDNSVKLFDAGKGTLVGTFKIQGSRRGVALAFAPNGKTLYALAQQDEQVVALSVPDLKPLHVHRFDGLNASVGAIAVSAKEVFVCLSETIEVFDTRLRPRRHFKQKANRIAVSPNGKLLVVATPYDAPAGVFILDAATGRTVKELEKAVEDTFEWEGAVAFAQKGKRIVGGEDHTVMLWDAATGKRALR